MPTLPISSGGSRIYALNTRKSLNQTRATNMRFAPCAQLIFLFHMTLGGTLQTNSNSQTYQLCKGSQVAMQCHQSVLSLAVMTRCLSCAETLLTGAIVEHNLPVAFADYFGQLLQWMCPDSKIALKFSCACTKATSIVNFMADDIALTDF